MCVSLEAGKSGEERRTAEDESNEKEDGKEEEEEEMKLTETEENIVAYLTEGELLQHDILEKMLSTWWNEEPFKLVPYK